MIDRLLYFDEGTLYSRFAQYMYPPAFYGQSHPDRSKIAPIYEALGFLEKFLEGRDFAVGENITIADHTLIATVSSIKAVGEFDLSKYKNICNWVQRCKDRMPGYEAKNNVGAMQFGELMKAKFAQFK